MVSAIVEILVAENSAPSFVTVALPRFVASAVKATGVHNALITELALKAKVASATKENDTIKNNKNIINAKILRSRAKNKTNVIGRQELVIE